MTTKASCCVPERNQAAFELRFLRWLSSPICASLVQPDVRNSSLFPLLRLMIAAASSKTGLGSRGRGVQPAELGRAAPSLSGRFEASERSAVGSSLLHLMTLFY